MPPKTKIYRDGSQDPYTAGGFWTPDTAYVGYCKPGASSLWEATLKPGSMIKKITGSPSKAVISRHEGKADVLEFGAWDYETVELVVLNPDVLSNVKRVRMV